MTTQELLQFGIQKLSSCQILNPRLDVELFLCEVLKSDRVGLILKHEHAVSAEVERAFMHLIQRRSLGEPVAYILGYKDFYKSRFQVDNRVLIPRPETELMVEKIVNEVRDGKLTAPLILDLGCGSGCIGLSILKEVPGAILVGVDISAGATALSEENAKKLNFEVGGDCLFLNTPAENEFAIMASIKNHFQRDKIDILVSNPPYLDFLDPMVEAGVRLYEPQQALFAKEDGMGCILEWSKLYSHNLSKQALFMVEFGLNQHQKALEHVLSLKSFDNAEIIKDLSGIERFVFARK